MHVHTDTLFEYEITFKDGFKRVFEKKETRRIEKMADNSSDESKIRPRGTSRKQKEQTDTPVRRSVRLQKAPLDRKAKEVPIDENNNSEKTVTVHFEETSISPLLRMKQWIQKHPIIERTIPAAIFLIFVTFLFYFADIIVPPKTREQISSIISTSGKRILNKANFFFK